MNQVRIWTGNCQQCGRETVTYTMSVFDVKLICMECHDGEVRCRENESDLKPGKESEDR